MIDLALMTGFRPPLGSQTAHFLTGLEPTRLRQLYAQGFEVDFEGWWDPRSAIVVSSLAEVKESRAAKGSNGAVLGSGKALLTWLKPIAKPAVDTLREDADASSSQEPVLGAISRQLFRMTYALNYPPTDGFFSTHPLPWVAVGTHFLPMGNHGCEFMGG